MNRRMEWKDVTLVADKVGRVGSWFGRWTSGVKERYTVASGVGRYSDGV